MGRPRAQGSSHLTVLQDKVPTDRVAPHHWNALYLSSALCLMLMTLAAGTQPLFLRDVLKISSDNAGTINANIAVLTEALELLVVGLVGVLSDRLGRVRILTIGFTLAGVGALMAPFSAAIAGALGGGGLILYYLSRLVMAAGIGAIWPQVSTLAGDYSSEDNRARLMSNNAFMMSFGKSLVYLILMRIPLHAGVIVTMLVIALAAFGGALVARTGLIDVAPKMQGRAIPWREIKRLLRDNPKLRLCFATAFLSRSDMVITAIFLMLWYVYFSDIVNVTDAEAAARGGLMIGLAGVTVMLSIPVWKRVIQAYGRVPAVIGGLALSGLGFILLGLIANPFDWYILAPVVMTAAGQAGCFVAPQILTVDLAPSDILGSVMGAFNLVGGLGIIFFVQVGGVLFDIFGPTAPFIFVGLANFLVIAYGVLMLGLSIKDRTDLDPIVEGL